LKVKNKGGDAIIMRPGRYSKICSLYFIFCVDGYICTGHFRPVKMKVPFNHRII